MVDLDEIQNGFKAVLGGVPGVRAEAEWPDTINVPPDGAVAWPVLSGGQYTVTLGGSDAILEFDVIVVVSPAPGLARSQRQLNQYVTHTGARSITKALLQDSTLGGTCSGIQSIRLKNYGGIEINDTNWIGAIYSVEVYAE